MPPFVVTVLKVVFLGLLYFFVYRALRSVVVDLRAPVAGTGRARATPPPAGARSASKPPRSVVIVNGDGANLGSRPLDGNLQIGRADACQIKIDDTYVSAFHARIFSRDGGWYVEDLGSTNGTYLNQKRVTSPVELQAGDRLRVGKTTMELRR